MGPLVLHLGELSEDLVEGLFDVLFKELEHAEVGLRRTQAIDAAHRGDDQHIAAFEE